MNNNHRRRKKRHTHGTKTVDVCRGKSGYGFTISGQQPCILSCIVAGSPADLAGLKTGDYLLHVNNLNVSKASHDEVVRLIGSSSGTLTLVIAENDNASDSSDDDFQARPKNKYPNRVRLRQYAGKGTEKDGSGGFGRERSENVRGRHAGNIQQQHKKQHQVQQHQQVGQPQMRLRALSPVAERYGRDGSRGIMHVDRGGTNGGGVRYNHQQQQPSTAGPILGHRGVENMDPLSVAVYPRHQKHASTGAAPLRPPQGTKHTIITREMRMVKSQSHPEIPISSLQNHHHRSEPLPQPQAPMPIQHHHHRQPHQAAPQEMSVPVSKAGMFASIRIIVGYVGSVEMPRDAQMPCSRHQSIRSAVRRLRVDHRVHTLVLMEVYIEGIRMTNTLGSIVALYAADRIAFSGTCPDDKRFFGIVTLHRDDMDASGDMGLQEDILAGGSSCHVFMVDPDMVVHSVHIHKARSFGIQCSLDPSTQLCLEFPQYASTVVKHISKLCRNSRNSSMNDGGGDVEPAQNEHAQRVLGQPQPRHGLRNSESNSSNSDSGLGLGREDPAPNCEQVYVVEMPDTSLNAGAHNASSSQDSSLNWTAERSAFHQADTSMYKSTGESDLSVMIPPSMRQIQSGTSEPSMSSNVNTSMSSNDASFVSHGSGSVGLNSSSAFDRLNLRVMPDPRGVTVNVRPPTSDVLDKQNSADNLRRSMQRYMQSQAQQRFLEQSGSDADSLRSNESTTSGGGNNAGAAGPASIGVAMTRPSKSTTRSQGVTAIDQSEPHKLSPRVFQALPPQQHPTQGSGTQYEFLVPAIPVLTKPPVPGRPPALPPKSYTGNKTPKRDCPLPERPKSTPPFRGNMVTPLPLLTDEEYDTDPGSVMGAGVLEDSWNGRIGDPEGDTQEDEEEEEQASGRKPRKQRRRFSEGFFLRKSRDKENVENSRLSKGGSFKQIKSKRRPNLSTSHESLVVPDGVDFPTIKKLNGAPSATSILHPLSGGVGSPTENGGPPQHGQRSARWAIGFDRLLEDCAGLATFTEFLKIEVSQENIEFWLRCENYKQITDEEERQTEAKHIWDDHLVTHASDSVNVDGAALTGVEEGLQMAPPTLFDSVQTHIFQLMKQDSYPRFLKSELYKQCVVAEMEGKSLPFPGTGLDSRNRDAKKPITKSKSTVSMDKGKRRQSFFPFSWNKSKSEKRLVKSGSEGGDPPRWAHKNDDGTEDSGKDENKEFCRVILPDGSTTVIHAKSGTPIKATLHHLCQRRTLSLPALEVFQHGTDKPLDLTKDGSSLASKSIWVEKRVLFQADLPSRRPLVVRAKPGLSLRETLKPILLKYNLKVENMVAHMVGSDTAVDLDASISNIGGQRLLIQTEEDFAEWGGFNSHRGKPPVPSRSKSTASLDSAGDDDHLVRDVMDGKLDVAHLFDEQGVFDPDKKHDKYRHEDGRTSGLFGFIRRNSAGEKDASRLKNKNSASLQGSRSQPATVSGPEMERPRPRPRPPVKDREAENLFEQLNKLSGRLDDQRGDQRGLLSGDLELPDFLKVDKALSGSQGDDLLCIRGETDQRGSFRTRERRSSDSSILDAETSRRLALSQDDVNMNRGGSSGVASPTPSNRIPYMDQSFSQDGVVPTNSQAEEAFATARQYPGSPNLNNSWASATNIGNGTDPGRLHVAHAASRTPGRRRYSPRSRTPDAKRTLLQEANGYGGQNNEVNEDLRVHPLVDSAASCDPSMVHMEIASYSPPAGSQMPTPCVRIPAPQPPPRKTLTTPKKFMPTPSGTQQQVVHSPRHSQQNSTSSELSHHSDSTTATTRSGSSGGNIGGSPSSTPSPTTHELFPEGDSSQESAVDAVSPRRTRPLPPPRPSRRLHGGSSGTSSADEGVRLTAQKSLNFDQKDSAARQKEDDMQVRRSYKTLSYMGPLRSRVSNPRFSSYRVVPHNHFVFTKTKLAK